MKPTMNLEPLHKHWHNLLVKVDHLSRRERIQLVITLLVVLIGAWSHLILDPFNKERKELQRQIAQVEANIQEMKTLERDILARKDKNPDQLQQERIDTLQQEIDRLNQQLGNGMLGMVSPMEMIEALKSLLAKDNGLTLITLQAPPPINLLEASESGGAVYQHTLILRFSGGFPSVLKYLRDLERLPWKLFWDSVQFAVVEYPQAFITLKIHTLSLSSDLVGAETQ